MAMREGYEGIDPVGRLLSPSANRGTFLAETARALSCSLDGETTLRTLGRLAVPYLADWCFVDLVGSDGEVRRALVAHAEASNAATADVIRRHPPRPGPRNASARTLATGQSILVPEVGDEMLREGASSPEHLSALRAVGARSAMTIALRARERAVGVVTLLSSDSGRRFSVEDLAIGEELARHAALALDDARLVEAERTARERAERAAARSREVQAVVAALSRVVARERVADVILQHALLAVGARAGAVAVRTAEGDALEIIGSLGFDREALDPCARLPLTATTPLADAVRGATPLFLESAAARREHEGHRDARRDAGVDGAWAALPLMVGPRAVGALSLTFDDARSFDEEDRSLMLTLAGQCAQALERARLEAAERVARAEAVAGEARYRVLAEALPEIVWITRPDGSLEYINRRAREYGGEVDRLGHHDFTRAIHPDHVARCAARWAEARRSGETLEIDLPLRRIDGAYRWHRVRLIAQRGDDGATLRWLGVASDVDDQKRAQESLRLLADASSALFSSLDYETTLAAVAHLAVPDFADECSVEILAESGSLEHVASTRRYDGGARAKIAAAVIRSGRTHHERAVGDPELAASGLRSYMAVPLVAHGRVLGALTFLMTDSGRSYDEDDRSVAEDLARRAGQAVENALRFRGAQEASRARDDLLAVVSHDLRNPLNVIAASAAALKRDKDVENAAARIGGASTLIERAVGRMQRLISDLLDVSQIEAHRLSINPTDHDLVTLLSEAGEMLRPLAAQKSQVLDVRVPPGEHVVRCDRERILQVFANLGGNAIKFTGEGGHVSVRADIEECRILFVVSDDGPGISEHQLAYVFDRYWRASSAAREGTGLGLSIAKALVLAHGGEIWVESVLGEGTTFFFTLPISPAH